MSKRSFGKYSFDASKEDKVLFPDAGVTKGDLIDYYEQVADTMLPYLKDRPVSMKRYPDGLNGDSFYQKDKPDYFPDWVKSERVKKKGGTVNHVLIQNTATLAYLANQACITPHVWLSRRDKLDKPDRMIVDLDPSGDDFGQVQDGAKQVRALLDELELPAFVMTTGSRGLHIITPLRRQADFDSVRDFAQRMAKVLEGRHSDLFTTAARKEKRGDKLYLDVARNAYAQTGVPPYSVRARPGAPVATPLEWDEVGKSSLAPDKYTVKNLQQRLGQKGDPWAGIADHAATLPFDRLERMEKE